MKLVFVYGTLKQGGSNAPLLQGQTFIGPAKTLARFFMRDGGGYPCVFNDPIQHRVSGEVYEVNDQCLHRLDLLEGHPNYFQREKVLVGTSAGVLEAWMYVGNPESWDGCEWPEASVNQSGAYEWSEL